MVLISNFWATFCGKMVVAATRSSMGRWPKKPLLKGYTKAIISRQNLYN